ncbi:MAG: RNB domain-containing ribonuclease [Bacilli bacterium]|nr:RNB domain-containing ribonuclease [Bacilli bacterium]
MSSNKKPQAKLISIEKLKKSLSIRSDEELINFLLKTLMERTKNINIGSRGFSSYRKSIDKIFCHLKILLVGKKYSQTVYNKLTKITNLLKNNIQIYNDEHEETHLLDSVLKDCELCKKIINKEKKNILIEKSNTNCISFPNIKIGDGTIDDIIAMRYNPKEELVDFSDKYVLSIDSEKAHCLDDAISIDKLANGNYLLGIYITNVAEAIRIGSKKDKSALRKNIKGERMFAPDITNYYSLAPNICKNVIACILMLDADFNIIDEKCTKFIKAKIQVKKRLSFQDVPDLLHDNDINNLELRKKLEVLDKISVSLYHQRRKNHHLYNETIRSNIPFKKISLNERTVGQRIISELMIKIGSIASDYANENKYPFLHYVSPIDVQRNLQFFLDLNIINKKTIKKEDLLTAKYFLSTDGFSNISHITYGRVSSPLWRYTDLANQRSMNACFLNPNPADKDIYALEDNLKKTAEVFNQRDANISPKQKMIKEPPKINYSSNQ